MHYRIKIILVMLLITNMAFGQDIDTLRVTVLVPNHVQVAKNYTVEYQKHNQEILAKRGSIKEQKIKAKNEQLEDYNNQPGYTKRMFENELNFYDSLTIDNYISLIIREYIAYRLNKPFKIKTRLVFVENTKLNSDINVYTKYSEGYKNMFIINIPTMKLYMNDNKLEVQTKIELYSSATNEIIFSKETIGHTKTEMTDYPMCSDNNWDCAFVNSVYPNLFDILKLIADRNTMKK